MFLFENIIALKMAVKYICYNRGDFRPRTVHTHKLEQAQTHKMRRIKEFFFQTPSLSLSVAVDVVWNETKIRAQPCTKCNPLKAWKSLLQALEIKFMVAHAHAKPSRWFGLVLFPSRVRVCMFRLMGDSDCHGDGWEFFLSRLPLLALGMCGHGPHNS